MTNKRKVAFLDRYMKRQITVLGFETIVGVCECCTKKSVSLTIIEIENKVFGVGSKCFQDMKAAGLAG